MIVDWCLNLANHELGDRRSGARDNAGDLDGVILSQIQEEIPVACICSVEFIPIKINAGQSKSTLKIPLVVRGVVHEVEGV